MRSKAVKTTTLVPTALLLFLLPAAGPVAEAADAVFGNPREIPIPPLNEIRTPEIDRRVLDNGLIVYLLENHDFPLVDFQALVRVGAIYEPADKKGLASLTGTVMRSGGTQTIPGDALDLKLESMGASLEARIRDTQGSVTASFLAQDALAGLDLLFDVMRNPAFPEEKLGLAKVDERTQIASRNDEPTQIAFREFRKLMYGADSPYGWHPEYADMAAITRQDLVSFHDRFFHPDRVILTVFGDFDAEAMMAGVERTFGAWEPNGKGLPPDPPVSDSAPEGVYYARKEGVTQSTVLFGLPGTLASDPDYAALQLLNTILGGGGFTNRLINEIRTKRGLAYAVGSGPGIGWHHPGIWTCFLQTKSDSTVAAAQLMRHEVERIVSEPVTEDELRLAKDIVLNELVFDLSSERSVLRRKAFYEYHGYPEDFLERYQQKVRTLTPADLRAAAQRHIDPAEIATVVIGLREDFGQPLEALGEVTEIDITIPDPPSEVAIPEPTAEALERGRQVLDAAAQAHGAQRLAAVETIHTRGAGTMAMMGQSMTMTIEEYKRLPDHYRRNMKIGGMFDVIQTLNGETGWAQTPQGLQELAGEQLSEMREDLVREPEHFLVHRDDLTWQALGTEEFAGRLCDAVYVRESSIKDWILYFDHGDHQLAGMTFQGSKPQGGPATVRLQLDDLRAVDGVLYPFQTSLQLDGEDFMSLELEAVEFDVPIDASLFEKPE